MAVFPRVTPYLHTDTTDRTEPSPPSTVLALDPPRQPVKLSASSLSSRVYVQLLGLDGHHPGGGGGVGGAGEEKNEEQEPYLASTRCGQPTQTSEPSRLLATSLMSGLPWGSRASIMFSPLEDE